MTQAPMNLSPEEMAQIAAMRQQMGGQVQAPPAEEAGIMDKIGDGVEATGKMAFNIVKSAAMMVAVGMVAGEIKEGMAEIKTSMHDASAGDNQTPAAAPNAAAPDTGVSR